MKTSKKWVTVLQGTIIFVLAVFLSVLAGCANPATGAVTSTVTTAQAVTATQTVVGAVNLLMANVSNWTTQAGSSSNVTNVTYTSPYGVSIAGGSTETTGTDSSTGDKTETYHLAIMFTNYSDSATRYTVNGGGTLTATADEVTGAMESGTITTGSQALTLSGGTINSESWNITNFTSSGGISPQLTFTGTVTCNGVSFDANSLSLGASTYAGHAAMAVYDGVTSISGVSACSPTAGTNGTVSCNPAVGVSVTGSYTNSGSGSSETTAYTLKVAFSDYNDSTNTGYTLTGGTLDVALTVTTATQTPTSIIWTGGPISLSGSGPVTTQTWNNVVFSSSGAPGSGTISSNGTLFDARTL